jgi:hypothetical protein
MRTKAEIEKEINRLTFLLPEANRGMPAHLIREKIKLLKWVVE